MDFNKLTTRFKQFGGLRLVREYRKLGALRVAVRGFFHCIFKRRSFKTIYPVVLRVVEPILVKKYQGCLSERKAYYGRQSLEYGKSKIIWYCWLQGMESAPQIVKVCLESLRGHLPEREIRIVDENNWKDFIELPDYIVSRWEKGQIPPANFSDLLRLELLVRHGGTWIDSTVLCTGTEHADEYMDADLFLFQYTPKGTAAGISISNWFISSCRYNEVLLVLRDMLFAYWKDYDCTLDYYIFHLFFSMIAKEYPERIAGMPYGYSMRSLALLHHWGEQFNQEWWDRLVNKVAFHKLSYRPKEELRKNSKNYYSHIINLNLSK